MANEIVNHPGSFSFSAYGSFLGDKLEDTAFSPFSIWTILSCLYLGARKSTKTQMESVLKINDQIANHYLTIAKELISDGSTIELANSIYTDISNEEFISSFVESAKKFFEASVERVDMRDSARTLAKINDFVKEKTHGLIKSILDSLSPDICLILVNAIYFKGSWEKSFSEISEGWFALGKSSSVTKTFLQRSLSGVYFEDEKATFAVVPFKQSSISMIFVLPKKNTLDAFKTVSSSDYLKTYFGGEKSVHLLGRGLELEITIPKFDVEASFDATSNLKSIGLEGIFDDKADFSGIFPNTRTAVSQVLHKAVVKVNKDGVEAAAVTLIAMRCLCASIPLERKTIKVDHPFVFIIWSERFNIPLFIGKIMDPKFS